MSAEGNLCPYFVEDFGDGGKVILDVLSMPIGGRTGYVIEKMMEIVLFDCVISQVVLGDDELSLQLLHQLSHLLLQAITFIPL
jgi:hypothetical protein